MTPFSHDVLGFPNLKIQYNLDYPNTLIIRMTKSVRISEFVPITEVIVKSMMGDFYLILQKSIIQFWQKFKKLNDGNHYCNRLKGFTK